jgi:hypothetical protein
MQIRSILCPLDFSEASRAALRAAARFARQFSATVHVVFVEDPLLAQVEHGASACPGLLDELRQFIAGTIDLDLPAEPNRSFMWSPANRVRRSSRSRNVRVSI